MRTNIVIDDALMADTLKATGLKTKREAVELGLRTLLRLRRQQDIRRFRGRLAWDGDLDAMRSDG
jgi:Arc/MetJ family transcription regulator